MNNFSPRLNVGGRPPTCSIIIPTRDRPSGLRRVLGSLDHLEGILPAEVIVVDGSREATTPELLDEWVDAPHQFQPFVLSQRPAKGPGDARNRGISVATGDIVAFTDDDCMVDRRWLANLVSSVDPSNRVVGVGGRVLPLHGHWVSTYCTFYRILEPPSSIPYLVSANCCYLRDPVLDVGGFDVEPEKPGGEDVGLSLKLARRGWKFKYDSSAVVYHEYRKGIFDFLRTFQNYGLGCRLIAMKHLDGTRSRLHVHYVPPHESRIMRTGYGELEPPSLMPTQLVRDLHREIERFHEAGFNARKAAGFLILWTGQRVSYWIGWARARPEPQ